MPEGENDDKSSHRFREELREGKKKRKFEENSKELGRRKKGIRLLC